MTTTFTLEVEATRGIKVKVGDRVKKGEKIDLVSQVSDPVLSPAEGIVEEISFDDRKHMFVIRLNSHGDDIGSRKE